MTRDQSPVIFLQVGSNDASEGDVLKDHIRRDKWHGVMIEPVPYIFDRLVKAWSSVPSIAFENVAISNVSGVFPFYAVRQNDDASLPAWYDQIGSFDRAVTLKHASTIPGLEAMIVELLVPTLTLSELAAKHALARIDVLQVDTEGHDLKVLQSIDFAIFRPALIYFEHKHLGASDNRAAHRLLVENGYAARMVEGDTVAIDRTAKASYPRVHRAYRSVLVPSASIAIAAAKRARNLLR